MSAATVTAVATPRAISEIAREIVRDWGVHTSFACRPYLNAMVALSHATDKFGCESAEDIVTYFLANAGSYRGEKARTLKAELKQVLKYAGKR